MKFSDDPNSECMWFARGCAGICGALAVAATQILPIQPWILGVAFMVVGVACTVISAVISIRNK